MTGITEAHLYISKVGEMMGVGKGVQDLPGNNFESHAHRRSSRRRRRAPRDRTESCETRQSVARPVRSTAHHTNTATRGQCQREKKRIQGG